MDTQKLTLSWADFTGEMRILAQRIPTNRYHYLHPVARGGVPVALELSKLLDIPLTDGLSSQTLVVDDVVDSGATLKKYEGYHTAVLHLKPTAKYKPTYHANITDKWVTYPWEVTGGKDEGLKKEVTRLLEFIGEDPTREGLQETPERFQRAWQYWNKGYKEKPEDIMKVFDNPANGTDGTPTIDQLVVVPKIDFYSMCEHHLAPFYGQIHIGYLPDRKVLGLSKFARLADIYSRRLQIQERIGQQIAEDVMKYLQPRGVGVVIRGIHLCMRSRGVEKQNSEMVTSVMYGEFRNAPALREEFMKLI